MAEHQRAMESSDATDQKEARLDYTPPKVETLVGQLSALLGSNPCAAEDNSSATC